MDNFNYETLHSQLGASVKLLDADPAVDLQMTELQRSPSNGSEWESFALILQGDPNRPVPQGIYRVAHEAFGEVQLFLSPKSSSEYEIVVNRKRSQ